VLTGTLGVTDGVLTGTLGVTDTGTLGVTDTGTLGVTDGVLTGTLGVTDGTLGVVLLVPPVALDFGSSQLLSKLVNSDILI
jgi:hypothetical protein